jgi:hypothetical protein
VRRIDHSLTQALLEQAMESQLSDLRTVDADRGPIPGGRERRRPERGAELAAAGPRTGADADTPTAEAASSVEPESASAEEPAARAEPAAPSAGRAAAAPAGGPAAFSPPLLGWLEGIEEELRWHAAGPDDLRRLSNGHIEIWGTSGAGKTQFIKALLAQLVRSSSVKFGISDFKNDYGQGDEFLQVTGAQFFDLWEDGAPYNPLALLGDSPRDIDRAVIDLRDIVKKAAESNNIHMGHRQLAKLNEALGKAFALRSTEGRWPTLAALNLYLDEDLTGAIGDLTRHRLFREGPPLGEVIGKNVVFGLAGIPGGGP